MRDAPVRASLRLKHTVWSECSIPNAEVTGLVIGVGKDSRMQINSRVSKKQKTTSLDRYVNYTTFVFFAIALVMGLLNTLFLGLNRRWYLNWFR